MEQLEKKKNKLFYAYEEEILSNDEFKERKEMLNKRTQELLEQKQPLLETLEDTVTDEILYDYLKSMLVNFSKILSESTSREQQKKLLLMLISEITINEQRAIDSIKLKINHSLANYMNKEEGVSIASTPSSFSLKNVGFSTIDFDIAI